MVDHRTTLFESNCLTYRQKNGIPLDLEDLVPGLRCTWDQRAMLVVAKYSRDIERSTTADQFQSVIMRIGSSGDDDEFIEAHIWGPLSRGSIDRVVRTRRDLALDPTDSEEQEYVDMKAERVLRKLTRTGIPVVVK